MNRKKSKYTCANCGAPIKSEICQYCNSKTEIPTEYADMEYPVIKCKETNLGIFNVIFPILFSFVFGFAGFMCTVFTNTVNEVSGNNNFNIGIIFFTIALGIFTIAAIPLSRYILIRAFGKETKAIVYGYMDGDIFINGQPTQVVKLLIDTDDGKKLILYKLADISRPYNVNGIIKIYRCKNIFMLKNPKQINFNYKM